METKNSLKRLLADGNTQQVIESLLQITESGGDKHLYNEAILQSSRFQQARQQERLGVAAPNELRIELARIHQALLDIIGRLPEKLSTEGTRQADPNKTEAPTPPAPSPQPSRNALWLAAAALLAVIGVFSAMVSLQGKMGNAEPLGEMLFIVLLGILAGIAYFQLMSGSQAEGEGKWLGMNLKFRGPLFTGVLAAAGSFAFLQARGVEKGPFDFTIRFEKPVLPDYPEVRIKAFKLWERKDWAPASVIDNEDLAADFKNLSRELIGKTVPVKLDARFWKIKQDSVLVTEESPVLVLEPDGSLGVLVGRITNADGSAPIPGVLVEVEGIRQLTDALGNFRFQIPAEQQKTSYRLVASKDRFDAASHEVHPGGALIIIRLQSLEN